VATDASQVEMRGATAVVVRVKKAKAAEAVRCINHGAETRAVLLPKKVTRSKQALP
jgi:hypothetical protein